MAQQTKFRPQTTEVLLDALRSDGNFANACRAAGISVTVGYDWMNLGRDSGNALYAAFRKAVIAVQEDLKNAKTAEHFARLSAAGEPTGGLSGGSLAARA